MSQWWAVPMLLSGGLFPGGLVAIAWERVPAWRASDPLDFRSGLRTRCDGWTACSRRCWLSASAHRSALPAARAAPRTLAALAAGGLLVVLVGSVAWLVPIQRRLVASGSPPRSAVEALRARWCGGHLVRSAVELACFVLAVVATVA
jgi:hypothetical protein